MSYDITDLALDLGTDDVTLERFISVQDISDLSLDGVASAWGALVASHNLLYDGSTGVEIGPATREQAIASYSVADTGIITIDSNGAVVASGEYHEGDLRSVYVA